MRLIATSIILLGLFVSPPHAAAKFALGFDWGNIKRCTSGNPNRVPNPAFTLNDVPARTVQLRFKMKDLDVPGYNHGGGKVKYTGDSKIAPGAFRYQSPCPPGGRHNYQWTVTAHDAKGKKLGVAKARKKYP